MSVTTSVAKNALANPLILRALHKSSYKVYNEAFLKNPLTSYLQIPGVTNGVNSACSRLSSIFRGCVKSLVRFPISKRIKRNLLLQKRSVILLSAGSFLGYHKDGKVYIYIYIYIYNKGIKFN